MDCHCGCARPVCHGCDRHRNGGDRQDALYVDRSATGQGNNEIEDLTVFCTQFIAEVNKLEGPATDDVEVWEDRKSRAIGRVNNIKKFADPNDDNDLERGKYSFYVYNPAAKVVALMTWRLDDSHNWGVVDDLVMLPGHECEDAILAEYAVNLSEEAGYDGHVYFPTFTTTEWRYRPSWLRRFKAAHVVPRASDQWVKTSDTWRLKILPLLLLPGGPLTPWRYLIGREITGKFAPPHFPRQPKF